MYGAMAYLVTRWDYRDHAATSDVITAGPAGDSSPTSVDVGPPPGH